MKNNKGITLVALVVTIVVLLILAGVSINLVLGDNGIVKKAQDAKTKTEEDQENMLTGMNQLADEIDNLTGGNGGGLDTNVPEAATAETAPYFPDNTFTKKEGTIDTGLVIQDASGNEYVWVVVPKSLYNNVAYNSNNAKKPSSSTDYANIEYCLQQYTATYRRETDFSDTWEADNDNVDWLTSDKYTELKNKMLKSVYEKGGFYVGRYEAGIGTNRTSIEAQVNGKYPVPTTAPVSKADAYPYTYVTRTQAQNLAKSLSEGKTTYTSSLMFGVQWDLVLAFMHNKGNIEDSVLTSNSTKIGNYYDNLWTIKNANAQYSDDYGDTFAACQNPYKKESASGILLTTGADSSFSVQNIYDIAGNVCEWTLENTSVGSSPCALRGGACGDDGSFIDAAFRDLRTTTVADGIGFRLSLW